MTERPHPRRAEGGHAHRSQTSARRTPSERPASSTQAPERQAHRHDARMTRQRDASREATGITSEAEPKRPRSRYIPALDGIRTFAVIAVVLYHLNFTWAQGGFLGVTMFFVLSGYLITRLLVAEFEQSQSIDLKGFWIRRVRRLVPATVTLVVVIAILCTFFNHVMLTKMRPDIVPSLFFFNNWWQILQNVSYFDALGDPSPLTHFWSLAIEEQFYVVWPLLLLLLLKVGAKKPAVRRIALVLAAASAIAMAVLYDPAADPSRVYYGTDTRAFSMLLGAWLAFIPEDSMSPRRLLGEIGLGKLLPGGGEEEGYDAELEAANAATRSSYVAEAAHSRATSVRAARRQGSSTLALDLLGIAAIAGLVAMTIMANGYTPFMYRGGTVICSLLTVVLIAACVQSNGLLARVFSFGPLVWLGKRSYSIYLWHYPLLALMNPVSNISATPWWMYLIQLGVVLLAAELSYHFIETPFRHGALGSFIADVRTGSVRIPDFLRGHAITTGAVSLALILALGGIAFVPSTSALSAEGADLIENGAADPGSPEDQGDSGEAAALAAEPGDATDANEDGFPDGAYDILMIGDSVSLRCVDTFNTRFPHGHIDAAKSRQFGTAAGIFQSYAQQNLAGRIAVFALGTNGLVTDSAIDELMATVGDERIVVFITTRSPRQWVAATNEALNGAAQRYDNVRVIDWYGYSEGRNDLFDGDGTHLTTQGAEEYVNLVYECVKDELPFRFEGAERDQRVNEINTQIQSMFDRMRAYERDRIANGAPQE